MGKPLDLDYYKKYRETHRQESRQYARDYRASGKNSKYLKMWRRVIILGYGGKCSCCDESQIEFLTIDHTYNDGNIERNKGVKNGYMTYKKIIDENFPDRYQILCWNCNAAKHYYLVCPHRLKKLEEEKYETSH